jgi:hypothetical protein
MQKITMPVKKLTELLGKKLDAEQAKKLDEVKTEDDLTQFLDDLLNQVPEFEKEKKRAGREEVYKGLDAKVFEDTELAEIIGKDKFDKIKQAKGVDKHVQLTTAYKDAIKAAKAAKQSADTPAEAKAYAEQIKTLQAEMEAAKVASAEALKAKEAELTASFNNELLQEKLFNVVLGKGNLNESYAKNEKYIKKMVVAEMLEKAQEKGFVIDPKKLTIVKADGTPHFVSGGNVYGIDELMGEVITDDMKKKAEATEPGQLEVSGDKNKGFMRQDPIAAQNKSMLAD